MVISELLNFFCELQKGCLVTTTNSVMNLYLNLNIVIPNRPNVLVLQSAVECSSPSTFAVLCCVESLGQSTYLQNLSFWNPGVWTLLQLHRKSLTFSKFLQLMNMHRENEKKTEKDRPDKCCLQQIKKNPQF